MKKFIQTTILALAAVVLIIPMQGQTLNYKRSKCDVNSDGEINIADVNTVIDAIFGGGEEDDPQAITFTVNGVSFTMIPVEGGTFSMGATEEQGSNTHGDEYPVHQVTVSDFSIGQTEVTQELWVAVMGSNPSYFSSNLQRPVEYVSWDDCQTFIAELNRLTGKNFRLPTEAEWEFAARGGNLSQHYMYSGSNDIDEVAWYYGNTPSWGRPGYGTQPVATKKSNELGLYDMSGNVWEWCQDWYGSYSSEAQTNPTGPETGSYRVNRGGGWDKDAGYCRVSLRYYIDQSYRGIEHGLRLAL